MNVEVIFQLAAIGIIVAVVNLLLVKAERSEYALMVTLTGLVVAIVLVVDEVSTMLDTVRAILNL